MFDEVRDTTSKWVLLAFHEESKLSFIDLLYRRFLAPVASYYAIDIHEVLASCTVVVVGKLELQKELSKFC